jgi:hypothetical protein
MRRLLARGRLGGAASHGSVRRSSSAAFGSWRTEQPIHFGYLEPVSKSGWPRHGPRAQPSRQGGRFPTTAPSRAIYNLAPSRQPSSHIHSPFSPSSANPSLPTSPVTSIANRPATALSCKPTSTSPRQVRHCSHRRNMCRSNIMGDGPSVPLDREVLPTNVKPTSYHLTLEPNLETFEYNGEVAIA